MISREEAFLIFKKLYEEKSVVVCSGSLFGIRTVLKGRIFSLSEAELAVVSLDNEANLSVRLDLIDEVFLYAEPKDFPIADVPESAKESAGLSIGLPLRFLKAQLSGPLEVPIRDKVTLLELRD